MVKLMPDQQAEFVRAEPGAFAAVKGAWGRRGATSVRLKSASMDAVRSALEAAWRNIAPKRIGTRLEGGLGDGDNGGGTGTRQDRKGPAAKRSPRGSLPQANPAQRNAASQRAIGARLTSGRAESEIRPSQEMNVPATEFGFMADENLVNFAERDE
jgi:hypothetical protein